MNDRTFRQYIPEDGNADPPLGGHVAYRIPRLVLYMQNETIQDDWQNMMYPDTRELLKNQRIGGQLVQSSDDPAYIDPRLFRIRVRYFGSDETSFTYGRKL